MNLEEALVALAPDHPGRREAMLALYRDIDAAAKSMKLPHSVDRQDLVHQLFAKWTMRPPVLRGDKPRAFIAKSLRNLAFSVLRSEKSRKVVALEVVEEEAGLGGSRSTEDIAELSRGRPREDIIRESRVLLERIADHAADTSNSKGFREAWSEVVRLRLDCTVTFPDLVREVMAREGLTETGEAEKRIGQRLYQSHRRARDAWRAAARALAEREELTASELEVVEAIYHDVLNARPRQKKDLGGSTQ